MADGGEGVWSRGGAVTDQGWWVVKCDSRTMYIGTRRRCEQVCEAGIARRPGSAWQVTYRVVSLAPCARKD